ncbi:anaerobic ribonucleoside-triphosphate reductase activating protein [Cellulomonas pakistanensis]|uniref:Anaerobic ribonucleoside-triphosphate reductase activating protein n=1 Tax=Cellulomonas pakistanensis TaxID=992287 RepID=A0A919PAG1_9CELL|nr:anaerobic ribonucleoside-triphosphate reductase activating protein [Cellulomonas pakistanensis]GIG35975.1 anaerobic ribonucleoside-triphosphate reductase activating protein [Cellulomonas pakistanensis]
MATEAGGTGATPPRRAPAREPRPAAGRRADDLAIAGLVPTSTVDWPGRIVATAFLQGCPWRCTYCHNSAILDPRTPGVVPWARVRALLGRREGLLDGVVFSGGEPTRQAALLDAVREVRAAGFAVGLHTGGAYPRRLAALLPHLDWVGLDVKAPAHLYRAITRTGGPTTSTEQAFASLRLVLESGVPVQVRTTVDPTVLTADDVVALTATLAGLGVRDHVLQKVRPDGTTDEYRAALAAAGGGKGHA